MRILKNTIYSTLSFIVLMVMVVVGMHRTTFGTKKFFGIITVFVAWLAIYNINTIRNFKKEAPVSLNKRIGRIKRFFESMNNVHLTDEEVMAIAEASGYIDSFWYDEVKDMNHRYTDRADYIIMGDREWLRLYMTCFSSIIIVGDEKKQRDIVFRTYDWLYGESMKHKHGKTKKKLIEYINNAYFLFFDEITFDEYLSIMKQTIDFKDEEMMPIPMVKSEMAELEVLKEKY